MADEENTGTQGQVDPTTPSQLDAAVAPSADGQKQDLTVGEPTPESAGTATPAEAQSTGTPDTAASNGSDPVESTPLQNPAQAERDRTQDAEAESPDDVPDSPTDEQLRDPEIRAKLASRAEAERLSQVTGPVADYPEDKKQFEGQTIATEHFAVTTSADYNGGYVEIGKRGNVGDTLRVSPAQVSELKEALGKVKNLPKE